MSLRAEIRNRRGLCAFRNCSQVGDWQVATMNPDHLRRVLRPHGLYDKNFCQRHAGHIAIHMETDVVGKRVNHHLRSWKRHYGKVPPFGLKSVLGGGKFGGQNYDYKLWVDVSPDGQHHISRFLTVKEAQQIRRIWDGFIEQVIIPHAWQPSLIQGEPEPLRYTLFDEHPHSVMDEHNEQLTNWRMRDHDYNDPKTWVELTQVLLVHEVPDDEIPSHLAELQDLEDIIQKVET